MKLKLPIFKQASRGFTLMEILIAISIIAILSTIGFSVYTQGQKLARDTRRKADLRNIQNALNLYHQDNKRYPNLGNNWNYSTSGGFWINDTSTPRVPFE